MSSILRAPLHCNRPLILSALVAVLTAPLVPMPSASAVEVDPTLQVDTANDADGDGVFTDVEEVSGAGRAVTFQVTVTNGSGAPLTIVSVTNTMLETTIDLFAEAHCPEFDRLTLAPEEAETCTFTLDAYLRTYGPQPREQLTNLVEAVATDGERELEASDDSTVVNPNARKVSVEVDEANDADGDGTFTDEERAGAPGDDVTFQVMVRNTSPGSVVITGLTDTWPGLEEPIDLFTYCPTLEGKKLWGGDHGGGHDDGGHDDDTSELVAPAEDDGHDDGHDGGHERPTSATCTFAIEGYAPAAGTSLTDTVTATVAKRHSPDRSATASDTSTVRTPDPAIGLEQRISLTETGPFEDHDHEPGLAVSIPPDGAAWVWYELEVTNTGDTVLADIAFDDAPVDGGACTVPTELPPAASFDCVVGPVAAEAGAHAEETIVTATGADRIVQATDAAHYRGTPTAPPAGEHPVTQDGTTLTDRSTGQVTVLDAQLEALRAPPEVLPRAGSPSLALSLVAVLALTGGLSLVLLGRGLRRHPGATRPR